MYNDKVEVVSFPIYAGSWVSVHEYPLVLGYSFQSNVLDL
jgi:hypothetical protein